MQSVTKQGKSFLDDPSFFSKIEWVGFDLDDTLHDFTYAFRTAMAAVYDYISSFSGVPIDSFKNTYKDILHASQAKKFVEDLPAKAYREERFKALFNAFAISGDDKIEECLKIYADTLRASLRLKEGALECLQAFKQRGTKIMVVTEGPYDAQLQTLTVLDMMHYVDKLFVSSKYGVSKSDGLLGVALKQVGCAPKNCLFIGDSIERDITPTDKIGAFSLLVDDELDGYLSGQHVRSLLELVTYLKSPAG